jgi:hypothetical protein
MPMDPNLRLAVERVNAWHLARLQAQFLSQAAERAPDAATTEAAFTPSTPQSTAADSAAPRDGAGARSH